MLSAERKSFENEQVQGSRQKARAFRHMSPKLVRRSITNLLPSCQAGTGEAEESKVETMERVVFWAKALKKGATGVGVAVAQRFQRSVASHCRLQNSLPRCYWSSGRVGTTGAGAIATPSAPELGPNQPLETETNRK